MSTFNDHQHEMLNEYVDAIDQAYDLVSHRLKESYFRIEQLEFEIFQVKVQKRILVLEGTILQIERDLEDGTAQPYVRSHTLLNIRNEIRRLHRVHAIVMEEGT